MTARSHHCTFARWLLSASLVVTLGAPASARAAITDLVARLREQLSRSSSQPVKPPTALEQSPTRRLRLNGLPLQVVTGTAPDSVESVLGFFTEQFMRKRPKGALNPVSFRRANAEAGYLFTVHPTDRLAAQRVPSGDQPLTALGPLYVVHAQRGLQYTNYVVAWSDRAIPPEVLDPPRDRDAPGEDLPGVPRPDPHSRRTFSMSEPASGYATVNYKVPQPPPAALVSAVSALVGAGFHEDADFAAAQQTLARSGSGEQPTMAHLSRGERMLLVNTRPAPDSSDSIVSYLSRSQ